MSTTTNPKRPRLRAVPHWLPLAVGISLIALYGALLVGIFVRYTGCQDECHGALVIPLFFSFVPVVGGGLVYWGIRLKRTVALGPYRGLSVSFLSAAMVACGVLFLAFAALSALHALGDFIAGVTGTGIAPPGWHPDGSDKLRNALNHTTVGVFLAIIGGSSYRIGKRMRDLIRNAEHRDDGAVP